MVPADRAACPNTGQDACSRPALPSALVCPPLPQGVTSKAHRCWAQAPGSSGWWAPATRWCAVMPRPGATAWCLCCRVRVLSGAAGTAPACMAARRVGVRRHMGRHRACLSLTAVPSVHWHSAPGGRAADHDRGGVPLAAGGAGRARAGERAGELRCAPSSSLGVCRGRRGRSMGGCMLRTGGGRPTPSPCPCLPPADDGEAAAVAAVEAGGAGSLRLWYGSHQLIDEWVHVLEPAAAQR